MNRREALGAMLSVPLVGVVPMGGITVVHEPAREAIAGVDVPCWPVSQFYWSEMRAGRRPMVLLGGGDTWVDVNGRYMRWGATIGPQD